MINKCDYCGRNYRGNDGMCPVCFKQNMKNDILGSDLSIAAGTKGLRWSRQLEEKYFPKSKTRRR